MSCIASILSTLGPEIEGRLRPHLRSPAGFFIRTHLPQRWVFETEQETVSMIVDREGTARVQIGAAEPRDVTVRWKHDLLASVLRTRNRAGVPPGEVPIVQTHTYNGQTAFNFLRRHLGL